MPGLCSPAGQSHRPVSWSQLPTPLQPRGQLLLPLGVGRKGSGCCWWNRRHQVPCDRPHRCHSRALSSRLTLSRGASSGASSYIGCGCGCGCCSGCSDCSGCDRFCGPTSSCSRRRCMALSASSSSCWYTAPSAPPVVSSLCGRRTPPGFGSAGPSGAQVGAASRRRCCTHRAGGHQHQGEEANRAGWPPQPRGCRASRVVHNPSTHREKEWWHYRGAGDELEWRARAIYSSPSCAPCARCSRAACGVVRCDGIAALGRWA